MTNRNRWIHTWSWILLIAYGVAGIWQPLVGLAALICMLAPSVVAVFRGRHWCGHMCPRGSFNDMVLAKFSRFQQVPRFMKTRMFRNSVLGLMLALFGIQISLAWGSLVAVSMVFIRMIVVTTLITVILGISFKPRTWCMICPMGTLARLVSGIRSFSRRHPGVAFQKNTCVGCNLCTRKCPVEIDVRGYKEAGKVESPDCIKCSVCVSVCPKKSLGMVT